MEKLQWLLDNWVQISAILTFLATLLVTTASALVKLLPTLKEDNKFLPIVKGLSVIAMNRNVDDNAQRIENEIKDLGKINEKA